MITPLENILAGTIRQAGLLDPEGLLKGFGQYAFAITLVILVIECGVIFGAVLPGDSLLFIVGLLLASGFISVPLPIALLLMIIAAFAGNVIGYWTGAKIGPRLFSRPDSKIFRKEFVEQTHLFFEKFGPRAIVLARFVPIVRSIITSMAGIAKMDKKTFYVFSGIGAVVWIVSLTLAGYFLGSIDLVKNNIEAVTIGLVVLSIIPIYFEVRRQRKGFKAELNKRNNS
jgi:membrane-associated protein